MKLRINGNSIRLRLTPEEVQAVSLGERIHATCKLLNGLFSYELKPETDWHAEILGTNISISLPIAEASGWAENDQVGFEYRFSNGLLVLIEKDFQCLHPRDHENEDHLYPNPEQL